MHSSLINFVYTLCNKLGIECRAIAFGHGRITYCNCSLPSPAITFTDFENFTRFRPAPYNEKLVSDMLDQVISWGGALKALRTKSH